MFYSEDQLKKSPEDDIVFAKRIRHLLKDELEKSTDEGDQQSLRMMITHFEERIGILWNNEQTNITLHWKQERNQNARLEELKAFWNKCGVFSEENLKWE